MLFWFCDQEFIEPPEHNQTHYPYEISNKKVTVAFNIGSKN